MAKKYPKFFEDYLVNALITYQAIESALKAYINFSLKLIRLNLRNDIPFNFDGTDYEKAALGTLVKVFGKLSNNKDLVKLLNSISTERDYVAHQAYIHYAADVENESNHKEKVVAYHDRAKNCLNILSDELSALGKRIGV